MNCSLSRDYMMKYFDGEHNDIENAHLKQHLKSCKKCSKEFEEMKKVFDYLQVDAEIQPPEDFEAGVMAKINTLEEEREKRTSRALVLMYNAAILVSIAFLVIFVTGRQGVGIHGDAVHEGVGLLRGIYSFITTMGNLFYQTGEAIIETYYYYLVAFFVMVIVLQRTFTILVKQNRRGA